MKSIKKKLNYFIVILSSKKDYLLKRREKEL